MNYLKQQLSTARQVLKLRLQDWKKILFQTVKLHQKLGKPIPEIKIPGEGKKDKPNVVKTTAPKINFVPGAKLTSTGEEQNEEADDDDEEEDVEPVGK